MGSEGFRTWSDEIWSNKFLSMGNLPFIIYNYVFVVNE